MPSSCGGAHAGLNLSCACTLPTGGPPWPRLPNWTPPPTRSRRRSIISRIPARRRGPTAAGRGRPRGGGGTSPHPPPAGGFILERDGFRFVRHDTAMRDFLDPDEVTRVYYPEMEALIKAETGAKRVVVFDHTLRTADDADREAHKIREPVQRVHNDYTEWSGPQRVRDLLPNGAEDLFKRRFATVQVR